MGGMTAASAHAHNGASCVERGQVDELVLAWYIEFQCGIGNKLITGCLMSS